MFINVVITRVILFCPAVPPSPPSAPSLVPRNATSFVSLLAKLLVLRARLSLPHTCAREYEKEEERERERKKSVLSRESSFFSPSVSSTLSFFLLLSLFPLSRGSLLVPVRSSCSALSLFLSFLISSSLSRSLRGVIAHGVSRRSRSFSSSPSRRTSFFFLSGSCIPRSPFSSLPSSCSTAGGSFSIRVHTRESISPLPSSLPSLEPLRLHHTVYPLLASLFLVLFCPCRSPVFCTLRI